MSAKHLTIEQCDELVKALREDATRLPHGAKKEEAVAAGGGLPRPWRDEKNGPS